MTIDFESRFEATVAVASFIFFATLMVARYVKDNWLVYESEDAEVSDSDVEDDEIPSDAWVYAVSAEKKLKRAKPSQPGWFQSQIAPLLDPDYWNGAVEQFSPKQSAASSVSASKKASKLSPSSSSRGKAAASRNESSSANAAADYDDHNGDDYDYDGPDAAGGDDYYEYSRGDRDDNLLSPGRSEAGDSEFGDTISSPSGTPGRSPRRRLKMHRSWTHTELDGTVSQRIHRKNIYQNPRIMND